MASNATFADLDDKAVYDQSLVDVLSESTRNFVVDFGQQDAKIAFNVGAEEGERLLRAGLSKEMPVRWINVWAPNRQTHLIDVLGKHYKFSPRLCAIIKSVPQPSRPPLDKRVNRYGPKLQRLPKNDVELGATSLDTPRSSLPAQGGDDSSHYSIAKDMVHFQSHDIGEHFLCIGANWMHGIPQPPEKISIVSEGKQGPLWTWLVLCDDNTVISLHEDPGPVNDDDVLRAMRRNTHSILSQLSRHGHEAADPISIQTIRQALKFDEDGADPGLEGSSNLFYYLFDDWRAVYKTISSYRRRLDELQSKILNDMTRTSNTGPNIRIIPRLHTLGRQIRESDHLYASYQNTIERILKARFRLANGGTGALSPIGVPAPNQGLVLAQSAAQRFERLSDRIQFVILNETQEFLAEKEALYFNINAQKDSEATARLSRAATLLAKLSVLFLPVSLMTSYFSVQIPDLQHYTGKDYWDTFAIIVSISFVALFFFSRLLMWITDMLDALVKTVDGSIKKFFDRRIQRRRAARGADVDADVDEDKLE